MDATQALRNAENAIRDFIAVLLSKDAPDWVDHCGVSTERVAKWAERKYAEERRQEAGVVEERIIYYADFYDLRTILKKKWASHFSVALGDWKTFEVYLSELERLRDADAHRRELLPHQKHLIIGISGEIRNRIVRYRSKMDTSDDCFPRIESVRDNLGNLWVPSPMSMKSVSTLMTLRPGDVLEFVVTASDPEDQPLEYAVGRSYDMNLTWQASPQLAYVIKEEHIGRTFLLELSIRSCRSYHAMSKCDDCVSFIYQVLPKSRS